MDGSLQYAGRSFFNTKTITQLLNRKFTWPGMTTDVKRECVSSALCQKASSSSVGKAPLKLLPVMDVPSAELAFDLVGVLPRTRSA